MAEFIDLTCEEEYDFSDMEGITEDDLAAINVIEVQRQAELLQDFPKCRISPEPRDIVGRALERAMSDDIEIEIVTPTKESEGVSVEESTKEVENAGRFVAKKSLPEDKVIQISVKSMGFEVKNEVVEEDNLNDSGFGEVSNQDGDDLGSKVGEEVPQDQQEKMDMDDGAGNGSSNLSDGFRSAGEEQQRQQRREDQQEGNRRGAGSSMKFSFEKVVIPFASTKGMTEENMSISSQITKAVVEVSSVKSFDDGNIFKNGEGGFIKHDFPMVDAEKLRGPDPSPIDIDSGDFISVREVAIPGRKTMRTVPFGVGIVSFILVDFVDGKWKVPSINDWEEMVNTIEEKVIREYSSLRYVMAQTRRWKGCGSFGLRGEDVNLLEAWRDLVPLIKPSYNTFPRDALLMSEEVSIMLMDDLKTYKLACLPSSLFVRNTSLRGHVRITFSKRYGCNDFTTMQQSKEGWRLCYLEGDALFMQSLSQHSESDRFKVGVGRVTIRGGLRKPSFLSKRASSLPWKLRKWVRGPEVPMLRTLSPIPIRSSSPIPTRSALSDAEVSTKRKEEATKPIKPRTRSERLRIQKMKKEEFKRKQLKMKSVSR